ncbi:MAG: transposase family protein, partial [Edaphobacter sp.]|nr:transposase family protein [Edaphobacter sp.]
YQRKLADLPWEGLPVVILLQARKFFCVGDSCRRKIFTEPLPGTVARYARRSCRSSEAFHWLTLALGGHAAARLAHRLGLLACRSTLLRSLRHRMQPTAVTAPRVLGIDDWHGGRLIGTGPFCAIWKQARSSTYYLIGRQQPWPHGCKITPEQRSSVVAGSVLMPRPHAEPLRKPSRSPIVGTLRAT